jgi:Ca2+-binding EF-hand superfamily protein
MMARRMAILNCLAAIGSILVGEPALAAPSRAMRLLDTDNDGTVDLEEAKKAASTLFGTLSKDEYLKVVESRFKAADPDNDGTLDEKELRSRAGQALLRLLQ